MCEVSQEQTLLGAYCLPETELEGVGFTLTSPQCILFLVLLQLHNAEVPGQVSQQGEKEAECKGCGAASVGLWAHSQIHPLRPRVSPLKSRLSYGTSVHAEHGQGPDI